MFSTFRPLTPEEKRFLKEQILWTYDQFLSKVAEGRGLTKEAVNEIGRGRVWTGQQAREIKLVDELGGLDRALELAKSLAGIPAQEDVRLVVWPKRTSIFSLIFGRTEAKARLTGSAGIDKLIPALRVLEKENPWALMPFWLPTQ